VNGGVVISFESKGSFNKTEAFLRRSRHQDILAQLEKYGRSGVDALRANTPVESGETAEGWYYEVGRKGSVYYISWNNSHVNNGVSVAILLQYGHGTGTGGYVQGRDYINPAVRPIFDRISSDVWKVVTSQ
jgi:hypothetical protein